MRNSLFVKRMKQLGVSMAMWFTPQNGHGKLANQPVLSGLTTNFFQATYKELSIPKPMDMPANALTTDCIKPRSKNFGKLLELRFFRAKQLGLTTRWETPSEKPVGFPAWREIPKNTCLSCLLGVQLVLEVHKPDLAKSQKMIHSCGKANKPKIIPSHGRFPAGPAISCLGFHASARPLRPRVDQGSIMAFNKDFSYLRSRIPMEFLISDPFLSDL